MSFLIQKTDGPPAVRIFREGERMSHFYGYKSKHVGMTGSAVEVVGSGTVVSEIVFANQSALPALVSGTGLSAEDTQGLVVVVPASGTVNMDQGIYASQGLQFSGPAGTTVSVFFDTTR